MLTGTFLSVKAPLGMQLARDQKIKVHKFCANLKTDVKFLAADQYKFLITTIKSDVKGNQLFGDREKHKGGCFLLHVDPLEPF